MHDAAGLTDECQNASRCRNTRMPRCGQWLATAIALLGLAAGSAAQFQLFDDFEGKVIGPIHGQDGWYAVGGDNRVVLDPAGGANQALYVPSASSIIRKTLLTEGLTVPDGTARMLFMRLRVAEKQTFSVGLSPLNSPTEYSDFAPELGMANSAPNLDLRVWDDDGGNYEMLAQLQANTWFAVWVRVDTYLNQCEIWLTDRPGGYATDMDKLTAPDGDETFEFRAGQNNALLTFYIKTSGGGSGFGPVYLDDIYLEQSDAPSLCNPVNPPTGDCNGDGWVGLSDLAHLADCLLGPKVPLAGDCTCLDSECDADVDLRDVAVFQVNFTAS